MQDFTMGHKTSSGRFMPGRFMPHCENLHTLMQK